MFMDNVHIISIEKTDSTNRFLHDYPQEKDVPTMEQYKVS